MFGKNRIAGKFRDRDGDLIVNSIWYTIQGEGPDAGRPAIFIRLTGCNLRCFFCDTEFEHGNRMTLDDIDRAIRQSGAPNGRCGLVVITGGEPLLQNIIPLTRMLNRRDTAVSVETAGSVYLDGLDSCFNAQRSIEGNLIVCSPKTPTLSPKLIPLIGAWKYIVRDGDVDPEDGFPTASTQRQGESARICRPPEGTSKLDIYVQPMDEYGPDSMVNIRVATEVAMKHGYRLSLQMHKIAGVE